MAVTPGSFRLMFPEFGDPTTYPDPLVLSWLAVGVKFVNEERWGDSTDFGLSLWLAHYLSGAASAAQAAAVGAIPGGGGGILSSKSGGGVSASYDVSSVTEEGAGFWNATTYGRQYYRLLKMMGAGPVQIGTDGGQVPTTGYWPGLIL